MTAPTASLEAEPGAPPLWQLGHTMATRIVIAASRVALLGLFARAPAAADLGPTRWSRRPSHSPLSRSG